MKPLSLTIAVALLFLAPPAATAAATRPTIADAQRAAVRAAQRPSAFTPSNLPLGMPSVPRAWTVKPGRCSRFYASHVLRCWVIVDFPEWPGCSIYDLYRVSQHGRRTVARKAVTWTTDSIDCPGFGTYTIEAGG